MHVVLILLLPLLFLIGAGVAYASRRSILAQPDHHHWIVRLLGVVLFAAALAAVGLGTWRGTHDEFKLPSVSVAVPTHPPRPVKRLADSTTVDLGPTKLIGTVLVACKERGRFVPLCGESITVDWLPESSADLTFNGEHAGINYSVTMALREFRTFGQNGDIQTGGGQSYVMKGATWSSSGSGSIAPLDTLQTQGFGPGSDTLQYAPLSLIPRAVGSALYLLIHLTRADADDPLEKVTAAQWLASLAGKPRQDEAPRINSYPGVRLDPKAPPGLRMLAFLGPAAVLLLFGALAGSVCACRGRRGFAFAGLLAVMVLVAGALDAMVLRRRVGLATDAGQPESVRAMALGGLLRGTFFHRGAALARLGEIAADPSLPESLRQDARAVIMEGRSPNRPQGGAISESP